MRSEVKKVLLNDVDLQMLSQSPTPFHFSISPNQHQNGTAQRRLEDEHSSHPSSAIHRSPRPGTRKRGTEHPSKQPGNVEPLQKKRLTHLDPRPACEVNQEGDATETWEDLR